MSDQLGSVMLIATAALFFWVGASVGRSDIMNDCLRTGVTQYDAKVYDCVMQERVAQPQKQSNQTMKEI